jgi:hypothetical protein
LKPFLALALAASLAGCSAGERQQEGKVRVVEGHDAFAQPEKPPRPREAQRRLEPAAMAAGSVVVGGLEATPPVHGEFSDKPLPPELAHLSGVTRNANSTSPKESTR